MNTESVSIAFEPVPRCPLCGGEGRVLYAGLKDLIFSAPGTWTLKTCAVKSCGLIWLDPMPLATEIHKAYKSYYTHAPAEAFHPSRLRQWLHAIGRGYLAARYGYFPECTMLHRLLGLAIAVHPMVRAGLDRGVCHLHAKPGGRLLEIGCGNGSVLTRMRSLGWDVHGVEPDEQALLTARSAGIDVLRGTIEDQGYPDGHFDSVVMIHVIEHVPSPVQTLRECHRVIKPGGRLVAITPNSNALGHRLFQRHWRGLEPPRHMHIFNRESVTRAFSSAGFHLESIFSTVRGADGMYESSLRLLEAEQPGDRTKRGPMRRRVESKLFQSIEWVMSAAGRQAGEEMVVIAVKS